MKLSEFKKLIREEIRKIVKEENQNVMSEAVTLDPNKKFYFTPEVFDEFWIKLTKTLAANKTYGAEAEEGSFAISPNSMEEAKKKVEKMESKYEDDY